MREEERNPSHSLGDSKWRCNVCSRLRTKRNSKGQTCSCSGKAFFLSKITLVERILYAFGWHVDSLEALELSDKPIAGNEETMNKAWSS